jgi:hypothetical protein
MTPVIAIDLPQPADGLSVAALGADGALGDPVELMTRPPRIERRLCGQQKSASTCRAGRKKAGKLGPRSQTPGVRAKLATSGPRRHALSMPVEWNQGIRGARREWLSSETS